MNILFARRIPFFLSLVTLTVLGNGLSAQAGTTEGAATDNSAKPEVSQKSSQQINNAKPMPGTAATSAAALSRTKSPTTQPTGVKEAAEPLVAQNRVEDVRPGRATIGGLSYFGVGGSFGTNNAFAVVSKIGLTTDLSVRPAVTIEEDEAYFRIPLTYEFAPIPPGANFTGFASLSPYIGGGITVNTDGDTSALATAGVDFPLGPRFTGTVNVNVDFLDDTQVAAVIGFGYNFAGF
jgi:hypothetical protein